MLDLERPAKDPYGFIERMLRLYPAMTSHGKFQFWLDGGVGAVALEVAPECVYMLVHEAPPTFLTGITELARRYGMGVSIEKADTQVIIDPGFALS